MAKCAKENHLVTRDWSFLLLLPECYPQGLLGAEGKSRRCPSPSRDAPTRQSTCHALFYTGHSAR